MAYNPYSAINTIYKLKGDWSKANSAGNDDAKKDAADKAKAYYDELRANGYGDVADKLNASEYEASKSIKDYYAKTGRSATRPYLYSLGKAYGMSESDVDKIVQYDNTTGEISIGGKKVGAPDAISDGVSYWSDTSVLDSAFDDYITRSGTVRSKASAVNQENESLFKKYNQEFEDLKSTNPFTTDEAKAIMAKYDLAGLQGRDNAVASSSGSNGGNIDSFAAANALRQQSALVSQGQQAVMSAYQQKLDHARQLLSDMGVNIDRVYNQDETTKNNEVERDVAVSEVTGVVPDSMAYSSNPFFNEDGTLKNEQTDYQAIINNANEKLKTTTNSAEKANLEATIKYATQARTYKIQNNPLYAKYANTISLWSPDETADYKIQNKKIESDERMNDKQIAGDEQIARINAQNKLDQIEATTESEKEIMQEESRLKSSASSGSPSGYPGSGAKPTLTAAQAVSAVKDGIITEEVINTFNYYYGTDYTLTNPPTLDDEGNLVVTSGNVPGETVNVVSVGAIDEDRIKKCGVDENGLSMIKALQSEANANGGVLTEEEVFDYVVGNSNAHNTNKNQLKKVYSYLGLDTTKIDDGVEDAGTFPWQWGEGVTKK